MEGRQSMVTKTCFYSYSVHDVQVKAAESCALNNIDRLCIIICKLMSRASWSML